MHEELASIGKSIVINSELSGSEDLTIEGHVEGKIELRDHVLTGGSNGHIKAQVTATSIVVLDGSSDRDREGGHPGARISRRGYRGSKSRDR
jgi:hypothetical protein